MARARNIKPGFFTNEDLVELDFATRLLFAGLWTVADKAGRLEDRPKKIKIDVFPADDVDIEAMLAALAVRGFIQRYRAGEKAYIQVLAWEKHQKPHHTEKESVIPPPNGELTVKTSLEKVSPPELDRGNPPDSLIPDSGFTDSSVPIGTGAEAPTYRELVFSQGVPLLTSAGVQEKHARSMLAGLCKKHGERNVVLAIAKTASDHPGEPVSWLQALLNGQQKAANPPRHYDDAEKTARMLADQSKGTKTMPPELRQVVAQMTGRKVA